MFYLITISLLLIVVIVSFINSAVNIRRQIHFNEMNVLYEKMELYAYNNNLQNKREVVDYLVPFKNYVVNTDYADIEILMGMLRNFSFQRLELQKRRYDLMTKQLPDNLKKIGDEFDRHLLKAIKLSMYRSNFILYFIKETFVQLFKSVIHRSVKELKSFFVSLPYAFRYENVIWSKTKQFDCR